jgi:hypothetical protein
MGGVVGEPFSIVDRGRRRLEHACVEPGTGDGLGLGASVARVEERRVLVG